MSVRPAAPDDVATILELVRELATYEREPDAVRATEADLHAALFGPHPAASALIAEHAEDSGAPVVAGFALWFVTFSTWVGRPGIHLEDLYVRPQLRGHGHGKALLRALARTCVERAYGRLEWSVLDWNQPAIDFYAALGAQPLGEWTTWRLAHEPLERLAGGG